MYAQHRYDQGEILAFYPQGDELVSKKASDRDRGQKGIGDQPPTCLASRTDVLLTKVIPSPIHMRIVMQSQLAVEQPEIAKANR